jgi:hypothetical protein
VTSFNAGEGDFYAVDGARLGATGWNNLSLQDIPPTYRWIVQSSGTKLTPSIDFTDAYEGGSSLQLSGRLDAANTVRLYQTRLPVAGDTKLSVVVKNQAAGPTNLAAAVSFTDDPTSFSYVGLGATTGTGWETRTLDLSAYAGRTIAQLGLRADAAETVDAYSIRVGRLAVYDGDVDAVDAPSDLSVLGATAVTSTRQSLRLAWTAATGAVHHYDVFRRNADGTRTYLGGTTDDAYFVSQLDRAGDEPSTTIEVQAVGAEGGRSTAVSTDVPWSDTPIAANLALGQPATADSQCATTESPAKAVNGSVTGGTTDKWCSLGAGKWLEVDLGSARTLLSFVVKHAGAGGESTAWNTRDFTIAVRSGPADPWQTVVTVSGNTDSTTTHPVSATARYVRLTVTAPTQTTDSAARIYEFEAWGT